MYHCQDVHMEHDYLESPQNLMSIAHAIHCPQKICLSLIWQEHHYNLASILA